MTPSCWYTCPAQYQAMIWMTVACGIALLGLASLLYLVFLQQKLYLGPLVLGVLFLLFALWGQVSHTVLVELGRAYPSLRGMLPDTQRTDTVQLGLTVFALGSTALLLWAGGRLVLEEWPGALYRAREQRRTASRQRGP
jgi:hypothetical protein